MNKRNQFERTKKVSGNVQRFYESRFVPRRLIVNKIKDPPVQAGGPSGLLGQEKPGTSGNSASYTVIRCLVDAGPVEAVSAHFPRGGALGPF